MKTRSPIFLLAASLLLIAVSCGGGTEQTTQETTTVEVSTEEVADEPESPADTDDGSIDDDYPDETADTDDGESDTATEEPEPETAPGSDPKGDPLDGEDNPTDEEAVAGADISNVSHVLGDAGDNCFVIDFYGDGEAMAAEVDTYIVDVEVADSGGGGFGIRTEFRRGEAAAGSVRLGLLTSGRDKLDGAIVTLAWDDSDTLRTCVDSGDTALDVDTFNVGIFVFSADGDFWDQATGVAAS